MTDPSQPTKPNVDNASEVEKPDVELNSSEDSSLKTASIVNTPAEQKIEPAQQSHEAQVDQIQLNMSSTEDKVEGSEGQTPVSDIVLSESEEASENLEVSESEEVNKSDVTQKEDESSESEVTDQSNEMIAEHPKPQPKALDALGELSNSDQNQDISGQQGSSSNSANLLPPKPSELDDIKPVIAPKLKSLEEKIPLPPPPVVPKEKKSGRWFLIALILLVTAGCVYIINRENPILYNDKDITVSSPSNSNNQSSESTEPAPPKKPSKVKLEQQALIDSLTSENSPLKDKKDEILSPTLQRAFELACKGEQCSYLNACKSKDSDRLKKLLSLTPKQSNSASYAYHMTQCGMPYLNKLLVEFGAIAKQENAKVFSDYLRRVKLKRSANPLCFDDADLNALTAVRFIYRNIQTYRDQFYLSGGVSEHLDNVKTYVAQDLGDKSSQGLLNQLVKLDYYEIDTALSKSFKKTASSLNKVVENPKSACQK